MHKHTHIYVCNIQGVQKLYRQISQGGWGGVRKWQKNSPGVASRGSYGGSKASGDPLLGRGTVWHARRVGNLLAGADWSGAMQNSIGAQRVPYLQGGTPTP